MQKFDVRPRFELRLDVPPEILEAALEDAVAPQRVRSASDLRNVKVGVPKPSTSRSMRWSATRPALAVPSGSPLRESINVALPDRLREQE